MNCGFVICRLDLIKYEFNYYEWWIMYFCYKFLTRFRVHLFLFCLYFANFGLFHNFFASIVTNLLAVDKTFPTSNFFCLHNSRRELGWNSEKMFIFRKVLSDWCTYSLLDNAPIYLVGCVIQKRIHTLFSQLCRILYHFSVVWIPSVTSWSIFGGRQWK